MDSCVKLVLRMEDRQYTAVLWAAENGITSGIGSGSTFSPKNDCTCAQIVTFLYRAAQQDLLEVGVD